MQLGMIGLGRMGANMVRRLIDGRPRVRRLRPCRRRPCRTLVAGEGDRRVVARRLRGQARDAARRLADGAGRGRRRDDRRPAAASSSRATSLIDGGNSYYIDDIRRAQELAPKGIHYVDVGTSGGVWGLERGYCMMIGGEPTAVAAPRSDLRARSRPARGDIARTPGRDEGRRHGRAGLPALRPERRRALREDGAQRHRVRAHGRLRRGLGHPARAPTSASSSTRSTPRRRRCATPSTTSTTSTCRTSPRCGGAAA